MDKKQPPQQPENPPSYEESNQQYPPPPPPQGGNPPPSGDFKNEKFEDEKESYSYPSQPPPNQSNYDPMNDPNVYKVPPQLVNITQANPQHLNPSYPQYQQNEAQRWEQGDFPKQYKHGAPLQPSKKNPNQKTGGGAFPGRGGATYNNAANR